MEKVIAEVCLLYWCSCSPVSPLFLSSLLSPLFLSCLSLLSLSLLSFSSLLSLLSCCSLMMLTHTIPSPLDPNPTSFTNYLTKKILTRRTLFYCFKLDWKLRWNLREKCWESHSKTRHSKWTFYQRRSYLRIPMVIIDPLVNVPSLRNKARSVFHTVDNKIILLSRPCQQTCAENIFSNIYFVFFCMDKSSCWNCQVCVASLVPQNYGGCCGWVLLAWE